MFRCFDVFLFFNVFWFDLVCYGVFWCVLVCCFCLCFCSFVFVHCFWLFCFFVSALRVFRAVTRLTVYRALCIFEISSAPDLENFSILFFVFLNIRSVEFDK